TRRIVIDITAWYWHFMALLWIYIFALLNFAHELDQEVAAMAEVAVQHHGVTSASAAYEPSLFGTYSKKIGMWLFLLSDSLTFGALLYAYSYGRISIPNWPTPFHSTSIRNATIMTAFLLTSSLTMVLAVRAAVFGKKSAQLGWLLATMACGIGFVILHGREWSNL